MSDWIEVDCQILEGQTLAQIKTMLAPYGVIVRDGFVCVPKNFNDQDLPTVLSALFALNNKLLQSAPSNQNFFNCLRDSFLCNWFAGRHFIGESSNSGTASVTLPAGGTWMTQVVVAGQENDPEGYFTNGVILEDSDDDNRFATGAQTYPGGTTLTAASNASNEEIAMSVMAIRVDCL